MTTLLYLSIAAMVASAAALAWGFSNQQRKTTMTGGMMFKGTPGPWRWEINRKHKSINLVGGLPAGTFDKTVLGFERYGMSGAAPVFHNWTEDGWGGAPKRAYELAVEQVGREHHADWFALVDHPNAHLIAAAPDLLKALIKIVDRSENGELGSSKVIDMRNLARSAIAKALGEQK